MAERIKLPEEIYSEVIDGLGDLVDWIKQREIKKAILLDEEPEIDLVNRVVNEGYAPDLSEAELEAIGNDPFLIAYALADVEHRCVVTTEGSKPNKQRQNRRIPDVCEGFGIRSINTFQLIRDLNFSVG